MKIIEAFATKNKCYQANNTLTVKGIMLHSIGVPQPSAQRMANAYNTYQPNGSSVCVHAFLEPGAVYQILPWNRKAWHSGGSANNTHIGVEMTEPNTIRYTYGANWVETLDGKNTETFVKGTYDTAVELFAKLCKEHKLDPLKDGVIISHSEGYKRGVASNHCDVEHIWNTFGLTMDGFRKDVKNAMAEPKSEMELAKEWAIENGLVAGYGNGEYGWTDALTRQQFITILYRMREKMNM